jgi:hypothetical protein
MSRQEGSATNVLFLSANPKGTQPLELIKECNNISDKIKSAKYGRQFSFDQRHEVSLARLDEFLLDYKPQIVHFSGHGGEDGILMFQDVEFGGSGDDDSSSSSRGSSSAATRNLQSINGSGRAEGSETKDVADLFRILNERDSIPKDKKIRCVVLNACYSQKQAEAISKYVDCVVGMKNAIRDDVARIFAESFYYFLCSGESIHTAFELGKNKIAMLNIPGQDIPRLLSREGIDPKKITFISSIPPSKAKNYESFAKYYTALLDGMMSPIDFWSNEDTVSLRHELEFLLEDADDLRLGYNEKSRVRHLLAMTPPKINALRNVIDFHQPGQQELEAEILNLFSLAVDLIRKYR